MADETIQFSNPQNPKTWDPETNVKELDPYSDPCVGNLAKRLKDEIYNTIGGTRVTFAEAIGVLEIIKSDLIDDLKGD